MKQPNWRAPFILSATLLSIGSFSYWLAFSHKPKTEKQDTLAKKPLGIANENTQIVQVRVKTRQALIELKCESLAQKNCKFSSTTGDWKVSYPAEYKGDSEVIRALISQMEGMIAAETIDLSDETPEKQKTLLEEYGLSDQKRTDAQSEFVEFVFEDGKKKAAWFGEAHPIGDKTFVGSSDNGTLNQKTIFLIANFYKSDFEKDLTYFRDKSVFHFNRADIDSFKASVSSGKLDGKIENGLWKINGLDGDQDRLESFFSAISQLKAKEFVTEEALKGTKKTLSYELHSSKFEAPKFEIYEFKPAPKPTQKGNKADSSHFAGDPHYYAKVAGTKEIYEITFDSKNQIDKSLGQLRESALLKQTEKLTSTEMTLSGKNFKAPAEFKFDGKAWIQSDNGVRIDVGQISSFIDLLIHSHATEIIQNPSPEVDSVTLTLGDKTHPKKSNYRFFTTKDDKLFAKDLNRNANEAYLLDIHLKSALPFKPEVWKMK